MKIRKCSAIMNSDFESGNSIDIKKEGYGHFSFRARLDKSPAALWFYFCLRNVVIRVIRVDLVNPNQCMGESWGWTKCRPVYSYDRKNWKRYKDEEVYFKEKENIFSFSTTFQKDEVYIASSFPYTVSDLNLYLKKVKDNKNLKISSIGNTKEGRKIFLLTVEDRKQKGREKIGIWLTARHHAMEASASYVLEGLIDYLLSNFRVAEKLRKKCIFKIIPMVDLDSVYHGAFGKDTAPVDFCLDYYEAPYHPEIRSIQSSIINWKKNNSLDIFVDFHCPEIQEPHYIPLPGGNLLPIEYRNSIGKFSQLLEKHSGGDFKFKDCYEPYWMDKDLIELSASGNHWREPFQTLSFSLEISYNQNSRGDYTTLASLRRLGVAFGKAIYEFLEKYGKGSWSKEKIFPSFVSGYRGKEFANWIYWQESKNTNFLVDREKDGQIFIKVCLLKREKYVTFATGKYSIKNKIQTASFSCRAYCKDLISKISFKVTPRYYGKSGCCLHHVEDIFFEDLNHYKWESVDILLKKPKKAVEVRLFFKIYGNNGELWLKPIKML